MNATASRAGMQFYVFNERTAAFNRRPYQDVVCSECGADADDMELRCVDETRGEWMLECECGEQVFTHND